MEGHEAQVLFAMAFMLGVGYAVGLTMGKNKANKAVIEYNQKKPMRLLEEAVNELYNFRK
jgi:hypothetical protein